MKKLFFALMLLPMFAHAQLPVKDGKVFYEVVDTCSLTKEQLYNKTKLWLANTFNDSKSVIEVDDKENGEIVGKGNFDFTCKYSLVNVNSTCFFTIKIDVKDNKYRLQLYNVYTTTGYADNKMSDEEIIKKSKRNPYDKIASQINDGINKLISEYKNNLKKDDANF
jgi:hypothetical protein